MKDHAAPFLGMALGLILAVGAVWWTSNWVVEHAPVPQAAQPEWREIEEDHDTSLPLIPTADPDVAPDGWTCSAHEEFGQYCTKDPPAPPEQVPTQLPSTDGTWGHGMPRHHEPECKLDDDCPSSSPHCNLSDERCYVCFAGTQCPGAQICVDNACVDPPPIETFGYDSPTRYQIGPAFVGRSFVLHLTEDL